MKRKEVSNQVVSNGFYVKELIQGFLGERGEGCKLLAYMGIPTNITPFSAATFLMSKKACWKDKSGNLASISFKLKPDQMECTGSYLGKTKSIRMFREWSDREDSDTITRMESEAIGDLCMKCIYDNLNL